MLDNRRQIVLNLLIKEYIARALPVGSRTLIERYHLKVSSATVRNELSRLEEEGFLCSPHTSSGRVPTDSGYRAFVDDLLKRMPESSFDSDFSDRIRSDAAELDELIESTSRVLTDLTDCLAVAFSLRIQQADIKVINLISITSKRLLIVVVESDGTVNDVNVDLPYEFSDEEIHQAEKLINQVYAGLSTASLDAVDGSAEHLNESPLALLVEAELFKLLNTPQDVKHHTRGISRLLVQPEFSDAARLKPLIEEIEDETILFQLLEEEHSLDNLLIRIGSENTQKALSDVSVIASYYGDWDQKGMIAVIGPTRMNYSVALQAVRAARNILQDR